MKRLRIPGLIDVITVDDANEITAVNLDSRIDRKFDLRWPILNWLILKRSLLVLALEGERFPTMVSRDSATRASAQTKLGATLDAKTSGVRLGPKELEDLACWLRGERSDSQLGIYVQQLAGQLFSPTFVATEESWKAAKILVAAPHLSNWLKLIWWFLTGKVRRAKRILAGMVNDNLSAMNGIGIASHNIVNILIKMKAIYADPAVRHSLLSEEAVNQSLTAPVSLLRQPTSAGKLSGCPFSKHSLFFLAIGRLNGLMQ